MTRIGTKDLAISAIFVALVCMGTIIIKVEIPMTKGYFNIGDTMIFVSALLFGPLVGGIAGGLGSAIADLFLAPWYFPGTLVIKGVEGAIVGHIGGRAHTSTRRTFAVLCGGIEMVVGYYLYESIVLPLIVPGWRIIAIAEVPFNVAQVTIGALIALPVVGIVEKYLR